MSTEYFDLDEQEQRRASRIHANAVVVDGLIATDVYLTDQEYRSHLSDGGVDAANFTVASYGDDFESAVKTATAYRESVSNMDARVVETVGEIRAGADSGEISVIMGFQDTKPIANDRWKIDAFADLGVKIVQLTYNEQNYVGGGCCEPRDTGLSSFGKEAIDTLNERGILIDLSHCGNVTTEEAIEYSSAPVACTHVGVRELCEAPARNKTDQQMRAVAETGGVVGISFFPPLVKREPDSHRVAPATVRDVLDHIDYAVDLLGVDHVGIGTDLDGRSLDRGVTPPTSSLRHYRPAHPDVYGE